jgi:hypothetical protein
MKRLWMAMGAFAVLMVLAWTTLEDQRFRLGAMAVVALFAVRTWNHGRKLRNEEERQGREDE